MNDALRRDEVEKRNEGKAQESYTLPIETQNRLYNAYDKAHLNGLDMDFNTYPMLVDFFADNIAAYEQELKNGIDEGNRSRALAFAKAFDIESSAFFDLMLHIERELSNNFDVHNIKIKYLEENLNMKMPRAYKEFRMWLGKLPESTELKISFIPMAKFYYVVITAI